MSWEILLCSHLAHLEALHGQFRNYFSEADSCPSRDKTRIQFPFRDNAADGARLTVTEEDQLIELSTDSSFRNIYETKPLTQFWISCQKDFPQLAAKAMMSLLPFATTYLYESGFSSLTYLNNKYRSRLHPETDMTLCLTTSIRPRLSCVLLIRVRHLTNCGSMYVIHRWLEDSLPILHVCLKSKHESVNYVNSSVLYAR